MENLRKHGICFVEASTVFADPFAGFFYDPDHSDEADRFLAIGISENGRFLVVSFTERGDNIRIISARRAKPRERASYGRE